MFKIIGYTRVSTKKQKGLERQKENILAMYPNAIIKEEMYTGTTIARPIFQEVVKGLKQDDTLVVDDVSRFARNAAEGIEVYKMLYERGVNIVFLKDPTINTENYRKVAQIALTGTNVDAILKGINEYLMLLAEEQFRKAFEAAEQEVERIHQRTKEGIENARKKGKRIGRPFGKMEIEHDKQKNAKEVILKHYKCFDGSLTSDEVCKLANVSRKTFFKYVRELKKVVKK